MKKILATLAIAALFTSCKKETGPITVNEKKLVELTYADAGATPETESITYDAKGRMLSYVTENNRYNFVYENDTRLVVTSVKKSDNTLDATYECALNPKGAITKMEIKNPAGVMTDVYDYVYEANNQMISYRGTNALGNYFEYVAEIVDGTIVRSKQYRDGAQTASIEYGFNGTKAKGYPNVLGGRWASATLFGKPGTMLSNEYKITNMSGVTTWHAKTTYEFDTDGYVTKSSTFYVLDGVTNVAWYKYQ